MIPWRTAFTTTSGFLAHHSWHPSRHNNEPCTVRLKAMQGRMLDLRASEFRRIFNVGPRDGRHVWVLAVAHLFTAGATRARTSMPVIITLQGPLLLCDAAW